MSYAGGAVNPKHDPPLKYEGPVDEWWGPACAGGVPSDAPGCPVPEGRVALAGFGSSSRGGIPPAGGGLSLFGEGILPHGAHPVGCPLTAALRGGRAAGDLFYRYPVPHPPPPDPERLRCGSE